MRATPWRTFMFGILGVIVGAVMVLELVGRTPRPLQWPVTAVAHKVWPSVVMVMNKQQDPMGQKTRGLGSGVIIDRQGDIVTNYHVVAGATSLEVVLANGRRYRAHVVGVDPATDLAVIHVLATHLVPIQFADSRNIEPGELVVALGTPLGLPHTVTAGVVSAVDRVMHRDGWEYHLIQTDAAINPGNSGGALVNASGQLIGINASKIAQTGVEGIGFAIPSNTVRYVTQQIMQFGRVQRPWLGVNLQPDPHGNNSGILVVSVPARGPAQSAGIKPGDFIVSLNNQPVHRMSDITRWLEHARVGQTVKVGVLRGSASLSFYVKLASIPKQSMGAA